jgi:hypothetical protein
MPSTRLILFVTSFISAFAVEDVNLALDAPVKQAFSGDASSLTSSNASASPWASTAFITTPDHSLFPEYVVIDLGECAELTSVVLVPTAPPANGFPTALTIDVADYTRQAWRVVANLTDAVQPVNGSSLTVLLSASSQGRFVRLSVTRVGGSNASSASAFSSAFSTSTTSSSSWLNLARLQVWGSRTGACPTVDPDWPPQPWPPSCDPSVGAVFLSGIVAVGGADVVVVDEPTPAFTWTLVACSRGEFISGFRVTVGSAPGATDVWDSGRVMTDNVTGVTYAGAPLRAAMRYFASVTLFSANGVATLPSAPFAFLTAKLSGHAVWAGQWLGTGTPSAHRAVYLRSGLALDLPASATVASAVATFSGLGYGELLVGGVKVNDWLLAPGWTQYNNRTGYVTADVTAMFAAAAAGEPVALAVILGDGWYALSADPWVHHLERAVYVSQVKFILDVTVTFTDGSQTTYGSGTTSGMLPWVWSYGAITRAWIGAENIDLTQALPATWATGAPPAEGSSSPTGGWSSAVRVQGPPEQFPGALLVAQVEAPTRVQEELQWQTHEVVSTAGPYIGGGQFWLASTMVFWVVGAPSSPSLKYQLNPGACEPCAGIDACSSAVHVTQSALDALPTAATNFSCALLPTANLTAHVFNFGREFQGWVRLAAATSSIDAVSNVSILICGSRSPCGPSSEPNEVGGPDQSWLNFLGNNGTWEPRFMYSSVQTVVLRHNSGIDAASITLIGVRVAMDAPVQARFVCSDGVFSWLHDTVERTQANYITAFPNDPTREKKGWTQDIMTMGPSALFLHSSARRMYERWISDILDNQAGGALPEVAPGPVLNDGYNGAWWGGMGVYGPALLADFTGDESILTSHYAAMRAYVVYLNSTATPPSYDVNWGLGDWLSLISSCAHNSAEINTPALSLYAAFIARTAITLGLTDDVQLFSLLAADVARAYSAQYVNATSGNVGGGFQCTLALALGVSPDFVAAGVTRAAIEAALVTRVQKDNFSLTTGFVTFTRMLEVLADVAPAIAHAVLVQRTPGALGPWSNSAGSSNDLCKEQWDGGDAAMPSLCGPLALWSFSSLLGLRPPRAPAGATASSPDFPPRASAGFRHIVIKPNMGLGGMRWANGTVTLPAGLCRVAWFWAPGANATAAARMRLFVDVPAGAAATIHMPAVAASVTESGRPAESAPGVTFRTTFGDRAIFDVVSGAYAFEGDFLNPTTTFAFAAEN